MISIYRARVIVSDGPPMLPALWNKDELAFSNIMDELFLLPHTEYAQCLLYDTDFLFIVLVNFTRLVTFE